MELPKQHKILVYGTLRSGMPNQGVLHKAEAIYEGLAHTVPGFAMFVNESMPVVLAIPQSEGTIVGEIFTVTDEGLAQIDRLEGHPTLYQRKLVELDNGEEAWMYLYPPMEEILEDWAYVEHGDYKKHIWPAINQAYKKATAARSHSYGRGGWSD